MKNRIQDMTDVANGDGEEVEDISTSNFMFDDTPTPSDAHFTDIQPMPSAGFCQLAKALRGGKWWMLKGVKAEYSHTPVYQEALRKEYDILSFLQHPGIVAVSGMEEVDGMGMCIVMEHVSGQTLRQAISAKSISCRDRLRIAHELMDALEYIHKKQVVHRDLKPSNIMLTSDGAYVKIIDFGLSDSDAFTFLKQPSGTESYMSPEQKTASVPDARNDIYSLGCVFECLGLGRRFRRVIARCKKPISERYQSVEMLRRDFDTAAKLPSLFAFSVAAVILAAVVLAGIHYHWMDSIYSVAKNIHLTNYSFCEGGIYYNILSDKEVAVEVTHSGEFGQYKGDITIPAYVEHNGVTYTVVRIGDDAFRYCDGVEAVVIPQTVTSLGNNVFLNCDGLATLNLPDAINVMGDSVIRNCTYIRSVRFPLSMTEVPPYCFSGGGNLHSLYLHEGITTLKRDAFGGCAFDSIALPSSLRTIERGAFWSCWRMKSIRIPAGVERIGDFVFWHCDSLADIYVDSPEPLAITNIFQDLKGVRLHVPKGAGERYKNAEGWKVLDVVEGN